MTEVMRPEPWNPDPARFHLEPVEDDDGPRRWRVVAADSERRRCRWMVGRRVCGEPSVAALDRGRRTVNGRHPSWWHYCAAHMFGRWVEDGKVWQWVLVENEERSHA